MHIEIPVSKVCMNLKVFPWHERFRVALACLFLGSVTFNAKINDMKVEKEELE